MDSAPGILWVIWLNDFHLILYRAQLTTIEHSPLTARDEGGELSGISDHKDEWRGLFIFSRLVYKEIYDERRSK